MNKKRSETLRRRTSRSPGITPVLDVVKSNSNECVFGNGKNKSCPNSPNEEKDSFETNCSLTRLVTTWPLLQPHVRDTILTLVDAVDPLKSIESPERPQRIRCTQLKDVLDDLDAYEADSLRRTILKALRHKPEDFGLRMDCDGWADVREVGAIIVRFTAYDQTVGVDDLISAIDGLRFGNRIEVLADCVRASYGHSTNRFNPMRTAIPDVPLFHGTSSDIWPLINTFGLLRGNRRFVQLTSDFEYAQRIASAHKGSPIVIQIRSIQASDLGIQFIPTATHVWLATEIPNDCLQLWLVEPPTDDDYWGSDHTRF